MCQSVDARDGDKSTEGVGEETGEGNHGKSAGASDELIRQLARWMMDDGENRAGRK